MPNVRLSKSKARTLIGVSFCVVTLVSLPIAVAQETPRVVAGYALQLEAECEAGPNPSPPRATASSDLIKLAADGPNGKIFVVDGAHTRCGDDAPLCGTGGCPLGLFRVTDGTTTNFYDDQALGWDISQQGSIATLRVHGSICGGFGPDPCAIEFNLVTGKKRIFRPRN
jgi:hypothetical protein